MSLSLSAPIDNAAPFIIPDDAIIGSHSDFEVVFLGPVGIGKTTAVRTLSSVPAVSSEVLAVSGEDFVAQEKKTTTVGIDMGMWERPDGSQVALFGTAGQDRFHSSRTPAHNPEAGVVLMLFGYEHMLREQLELWVDILDQKRALHRTVVGVNFVSQDDPDPLPTVYKILNSMELGDIPALMVDPRDPGDVASIVESALQRVERFL